MKKLFPFIITFLLLAGCTKTQPPPAEPADPQPIPPVILAQEEESDGEKVFDLQPKPEEPEASKETMAEAEPPSEKELLVEELLQKMSLEEKVGQMFFVRCPAAGATEKIETYHLGGYLLFTRDFKDADGQWLTREAFVEKISSYQDAASIPLLIGVDEEGGTVARASRNPNLFPEKYRSPQAVFSSGGLETIRKDTLEKSEGLLALGINVNFAPVADVSTDPADFIYDRAFGQDAQATAEYVETAVTAAGTVSVSGGNAPYRIGCVLKHFPGYGNNADTHTGIAIDQRPYQQFVEEDFLPFQAGIDAGAGSVLVSHNVVTSMDENFPASLSPEAHRILREELGFEGVILTDDLAMDAVESYAKDGSVAVLAVLAGNDMIVTTDFEKQIPLVVDAVGSGLIQEEIIDNAVRRVLGWKVDLGLIGEAA